MDNGKNYMIGLWDENALLEVADFTQFRIPSVFQDFPHSGVWDSLCYGRLSDLLSQEQFQEMQDQHNVIMATNHSMTEVYLGAVSKEELDRVRAKLDVLFMSKVSTPNMNFRWPRVLTVAKVLKHGHPTHLLWTEDYKEKDGFEMTFDTRFLANIDPAFIGATYLDLGRWTDSVEDYEMLAEAITLRLCRYDENRACHTSLIGPKLKSRAGVPVKVGKRRYTVRNRATSRKNLYGVGIGSKKSACISPEKRDTLEKPVESPYGGGEVEKWLNQLEESYGIATPSDNHRAGTGSSGITGATGKPPSALGSPDLIVFDESVDPPTSPTAGMKENAASPSQSQSLLDLDDPFIASEPASVPVAFPLGSLKRQAGNLSTKSASKTRNAVHPLVEDNVEAHEQVRAGVAGPASKRDASKDSAATHASTTGKATSRHETSAAQLAPWFILELNTNVRDLLVAGPYLRGKVSLRADLGRILITGLDYTALVFNGPGSESNGWKKDTVLRILNHGSSGSTGQGVTFTKMLTQHGDDIEYMLATTDIATGKQLWNSEATERVLYSFNCVSKGQSFLMDLQADESGSKFCYSLRTKQDDKAPIWVHCTLRSWDARIVMSHVDTYALEMTHGDFARSFVDSFSVTLSQDNRPHVRIGIHRGFGVSVESMRINTGFRFLSTDQKSYLEITEVEETVFKACGRVSKATNQVSGLEDPEDWMFYTVDVKRVPTDVQESEERGMPTFWYEASIRSVVAEEVMAVNQTIVLGEKAPWDFARLSELGVIASICKPALRMVQIMDSVGANNDNHQAAKLVLPRENTQEVPGANYFTKRDSSASSSASRARMPMSSAATLVQPSAPPGVVVGRQSSRGCPTPPSTAPSPVPITTRIAAAAADTSPVRQRGETLVPPSNNQNIANAFSPGATNGGGAGFGVAAPRAPSRTRAAGRGVPSSTGSDASRGPVASYKPPAQFW